MSSEIEDLLGYFKKWEAVLKNVNEKHLQPITNNEKQRWANALYSRRKCVEVVGIHSSVGDTALEDKVCQVFREIGVRRIELVNNNTIINVKRTNLEQISPEILR